MSLDGTVGLHNKGSQALPIPRVEDSDFAEMNGNVHLFFAVAESRLMDVPQ